jgi:hypothetical protein
MGDNITIRTGNTGAGSSVVGKVSGTGNVVGTGNTSTFSGGNRIEIPAEKLDKLPANLGQAMSDFLDRINELVAKLPEPAPEAITQAQADVEALVDETQGAVDEAAPAPSEPPSPSEPAPPTAPPAVPMVRKMTIGARLAQAAKSVLKLLPKTAETIAAFSPLAPFGELIGQGVEGIVNAVVQEG